jgi:ABC-type uncharacterized transport system fused permease/ATPase subunit
MMIGLDALHVLSSRLHESPAVVLLGPRQVGKTTLALTLAEFWPAGCRHLGHQRLDA